LYSELFCLIGRQSRLSYECEESLFSWLFAFVGDLYDFFVAYLFGLHV